MRTFVELLVPEVTGMALPTIESGAGGSSVSQPDRNSGDTIDKPARRFAWNSAIYKHRKLRMRGYLDGLAAEDNRRDTATSMRGHHNQIAPPGGSGIDDCLIDLRVFHAKCLASDARLPGGD